jgi:Ca-activated chloride channel family protein
VSTLLLAHPWLLALLPLPLVVWWLAPPYSEPHRALVVPFLPRLANLSGQAPGRGASVSHGSIWRWLTVCFCWLCVVLALARPQVIEPPLSKDIPVRDMLLAVDLSGSMATRDFQDTQGATIDRLAAVKSVLDSFLAGRKGDRVGLIFFGNAAFVQAPFTEDLAVVRQLLDEAQVNMAGPQTAFGDALGLAINTFDRSKVQDRVLIALTDGNDTSSQVPPDKAAQIARDKGIVIHTVAVGDPQAAGEDALDEAALQRAASITDGLYSHATDRKQLAAIYEQLNNIEMRKAHTVSHRPRRDVYWWPLAAALVASMAYLALALLFSSRAAKTEPEDTTSGATSPATLASVTPLALSLAGILPHFIRPGLLLALLPAALLWWLLRQRVDRDRAWREIIAPHLLAHLWGPRPRRSRFGPLHWIGLIWLLTVIAIAGPSWRHVPSPFAQDTAALAIVVKVTPSMETEDLEPSRLARATQKVHDLLQLRGDARTALIAYAGTAHLVMPATSDAGIIDTFAGALEPAIMPDDGDAAAAALQLAQQSLIDAGGGSIVWITDNVAPEQAAALTSWRRQARTPLYLWPPLLPGAELDNLRKNTRPAKANLVTLSADDTDIRALAGAAKLADTTGDAEDTRWAESGYWLTPIITVLLLVFFRRGWMLSPGGMAR